MKSLLKKWSNLICVFLLLGVVSCDKCRNVNCNQGTCVDGNCLCDEGYEGDRCTEKSRQKFIGEYKFISEECTLTEDNPEYKLTIDVNSTSTGILVRNLGDYNFAVNAIPTGSTFEIPPQSNSNLTLEGIGVLTSNKLKIEYIAFINVQSDTCKLILEK